MKIFEGRQNASVFLGSDCILSPSAKALATLEIFEGKFHTFLTVASLHSIAALSVIHRCDQNDEMLQMQ